MGYGIGIVIALVISAATSGGHLAPCFTIAHWLFRGFPGKKVPMYILAQIFGAYIAFGLIYVQYKDFFDVRICAILVV
jgi:glycerol uptake facilitator-like aquaporin